jgi:hypothetical protein
MSVAATIPFTTPQPKSQPWTPSDRDRLIFQWVKFDGHKQSWVAAQLDLHQTTVSRIVERYERWIARGGPSQEGSPNHDERLRAQRWLAYERNEWILSSALRIAGEMERALDTSKSTISRPVSDPSRESEIRTEHKVIDRSGIAARFLRLAHRINMDQFQLLEQDPLPALEPLSLEDADFPLNDLADNHLPLPSGEGWGEGLEADSSDVGADIDLPDAARTANEFSPDSLAPSLQPLAPDTTPVSIIELVPNASPVHETHILPRAKSTLTSNHKATSAKSRSRKKSPARAYLAVPASPETTTDHFQSTANRDPWPPTPRRELATHGPSSTE